MPLLPPPARPQAFSEGVVQAVQLFERMQQQDEQTRREIASLRLQDTRLRDENQLLRRELLRQVNTSNTSHAVVDYSVLESYLSAKVYWAAGIGAFMVAVCCARFWLVEYLDSNGDGQLDLEDALEAMAEFIVVSPTALRAGGTCVCISIGFFALLWWIGVIQVMVGELMVNMFLMLFLGSILGIFIYNIYLNITRTLGALFKELKEIIQTVLAFLEDKLEAASEAMEQVTGTMFTMRDGPGMYEVKYKCHLQKTEKLSSSVLATLDEGTPLNITKVVTRLTEGRIRGLVQEPKGWISIQDLETGFRWANKKEYQSGHFKVIVDFILVETQLDKDPDSPPPINQKRVMRGQIVKVQEVRHRMREGAVFGRIQGGWIRLLEGRPQGVFHPNVEPCRQRMDAGIFPTIHDLWAGPAEEEHKEGLKELEAAVVARDRSMLEAALEEVIRVQGPDVQSERARQAVDRATRTLAELEGEDPEKMHDVFCDPFLTQGQHQPEHDEPALHDVTADPFFMRTTAPVDPSR